MAGLDLSALSTVLFDVDGNLVHSEPLALEASAPVTNRFAEVMGLTERFTAEDLRHATTGRNFRALAVEFAAGSGRWSPPTTTLTPDALDWWVEEENRVVSAYLRDRLQPDDGVTDAVLRIADRYAVAAVSSSSIARLQACFAAIGLSSCFPPERCFSAEDSLDPPVSKPHPAVYLEALRRLGLRAEQTVAIEDSLRGAQSAVAAGCPTIGNLTFVEQEDRDRHRAALLEAGVVAVVDSWSEAVDLLTPAASAEVTGGPSRPQPGEDER
jgi:HAD superfamily hydrolase (TIGR01509 family)